MTFKELYNEGANVASNLKIQAARDTLLEAANALEKREYPLTANHAAWKKKEYDEDMKDLFLICAITGLSLAAVIACVVALKKKMDRERIRQEGHIRELRQDLEARIEKLRSEIQK